VTPDTPDGQVPGAAAFVEAVRGAVTGQPPSGPPVLGGLVAELAGVNLRQWDLEDTTRDPHATDATIAGAKRAIDQLNLNRHRLVHEIDVAMAALLAPPASATLATESPGMVVDRLSVLVIRRARTVSASAREPGYGDRVPALDAQLAALQTALDGYLDELRAGTRRFSTHEPLKLYLGPGPGTRGGGTRPG
jgi:hypothetical protein